MPTDPTGPVVRNIFALRQYENGLTREVVQQFERSAERLKRILLRLDPTSVSAGRTRARLRRLYRAADVAIKQLYSQVNDITVEGLLGVAQVESEFAAGVLDSATGAAVDIETQRIGRSFARSIVASQPIQGQTMGQWWPAQMKQLKFAFRTQVQLGLAQNETIDQIVRRVRGRSVGGGRFVGGVIPRGTRHATALVRTAVNEVATRASFETYAANDDITKKYEWVSTFDSRTSDICISLDGRTWAYDDPNRKMPPAHWNCRSTIAPIVDWEGLGIEPPKPGMRASADGPIPASSRYGDWLKNQSVAEQNKILGRGRAQLWRDGKLDLKDLVRSDGRSVTLGELETKLGLPKGWQGGGGPAWAWEPGDVRMDQVLPNADPKWLASLTPDEEWAIGRYTQGGYQTLNRVLTEGGSLAGTEEAAKIHANLQSAIAKAGLRNKPVTVWRGVKKGGGGQFFGTPSGDATLPFVERFEDLVGREVTFNGYQSSSFWTAPALDASSVEPYGRGVVFEIRTRRGINVAALSNYEDEGEWLIGHAERYRVIGVERSGRFEYATGTYVEPDPRVRHIIKLEVIDDGP